MIGGSALMATGLLSACVSKTIVSTIYDTPLPATPKSDGNLRVLSDSVPTAGIGWPAQILIGGADSMSIFFESFLRQDNRGNVYPGPGLAETYEVAEDQKSITFSLREGIKFHDGSDFNATVAKWNLDNQIKSGTAINWISADIVDNYTLRVYFGAGSFPGIMGGGAPPAPSVGGTTPAPPSRSPESDSQLQSQD